VTFVITMTLLTVADCLMPTTSTYDINATMKMAGRLTYAPVPNHPACVQPATLAANSPCVQKSNGAWVSLAGRWRAREERRREQVRGPRPARAGASAERLGLGAQDGDGLGSPQAHRRVTPLGYGNVGRGRLPRGRQGRARLGPAVGGVKRSEAVVGGFARDHDVVRVRFPQAG